MNKISRRLAATAALVLATAVLFLGIAGLITATASHADSALTNNGPSISHPVQHRAFPNQGNFPVPGSREHHHYQRNHAK